MIKTSEFEGPGVFPGFFARGERPRKLNEGFTLVELIAVIVVMSILAVTVLPRFSGQSGFEERGLRDKTISALRYAQKSAIASRRLVCVAFIQSPATVTFSISNAFGASNCSGGTDLIGPDGSQLQVVDAKQSFSSVPTALQFDAAGRPNSAVSIGFAGLSSSLAINVEAETGYVH